MRLSGYQTLFPPTRRPQQPTGRVCIRLGSEQLVGLINSSHVAPRAKTTTYLVTTGFLKELLQMKHLKGISSSSLLTS